MLFDDQIISLLTTLPLEEVFDPTGAGDTFAGGFIGYIAKTGDISFRNMNVLLSTVLHWLLLQLKRLELKRL